MAMKIRKSTFFGISGITLSTFFYYCVTNITVHIASTLGAGQIIFFMKEDKDGV